MSKKELKNRTTEGQKLATPEKQSTKHHPKKSRCDAR